MIGQSFPHASPVPVGGCVRFLSIKLDTPISWLWQDLFCLTAATRGASLISRSVPPAKAEAASAHMEDHAPSWPDIGAKRPEAIPQGRDVSPRRLLRVASRS